VDGKVKNADTPAPSSVRQTIKIPGLGISIGDPCRYAGVQTGNYYDLLTKQQPEFIKTR